MISPEEDRLRDETAQLERENKELQLANYEENISVFRAKTNLLLQKYPLDPNNMWLYFWLHDAVNIPCADATQGHDLVMLVHPLHADTSAGPQKRQIIRMIESETYRTPYGLEFFTKDVTVDHENDAQYTVDSVPFVEGEGTTVPLFNYDGASLAVSHDMQMFTTLARIEVKENGHYNTVLPFGHYNNIYDRIHALDVANKMLALALSNEPIATSAGRL